MDGKDDWEDLDAAELEAEIARHEAELAAAATQGSASPGDGSSSREGEPVALEAVLLAEAPAAATAATTTSQPAAGEPSPSTRTALTEGVLRQLEEAAQENERLLAAQRHLAELNQENERLKAALVSGQGLDALDSRQRSSATATDLDSVLKASAARRKSLAGKAQGSADLERAVADKRAVLEFRQRGVDICILMDCTGSMHPCIEAVKAKALEIMQLAPKLHPDALTRLAFVGYRDFPPEQGSGQHVVQDFVDAGSFGQLQHTVSLLRASGGGNAEDVTGALKKALGLGWSSTTRLLIHFGDSPCHGNRYHNGHPVNGPDTYPAGNPDGLVPEDLLRQLVANRVDYHFARIRADTDIMCGIFKEVYDGSPGAAVLETHEYTDQAGGFVPLVLKSLTSSMHRSFRAGSGCSSASSSKSSTSAPGAVLPQAAKQVYSSLI